MLAVGHHDYYYFTHEGQNLLLTIGDCENANARRFINSVPEHMFEQLCRAIGETIWGPNQYNVQNEQYMSFLFGFNETQTFIDRVSTATTFFALMPFDLVCLAHVAFMPFHDLNARWEIELDFGYTREFHTNDNPHLRNNHQEFYELHPLE